MKKIAFQGRRGAYSESAAYHLFGNDIEVVPMDTFEQIFQGIETGAVDGGAIPIENSTAGSIYDNYDLLYKWRHPIVGEVKLQISHSLCALPGVKLTDLKEVLSHPQGLAQCSRFFGRNPQIKSTAFYDTAGSAEEVFYGLDILAEGIENLPGVNFTRFYAIQKTANPLPEEGTIKTTLLFMLSDSGKSGALHAALGCFAKRNLNLTRIESRPHPDRPWEYIFHLSFEGSPKDEAVIDALKELQTYCDFVYRLGSFREGTTEKLTY